MIGIYMYDWYIFVYEWYIYMHMSGMFDSNGPLKNFV